MHDPTPAATATPATPAAPPAPAAAPPAPKLHDPTVAELNKAIAADKAGVVDGSEVKPAASKTMAELLPEKPTAKNGFVELGNLKVEEGKYKEFRDSMMYESKNSEMGGIVERLEKGPHKTTVTMNNDSNNEMVPNKNGDAEVHWDPKHMHIASNDAKRSPATRLAHELDHADEWTHNPQRMLANANVDDPKYGNLEEKRVITGTERRNVKALGEGVREDHDYGKGNFEVNGVTSTTPVLHQTRGGVTTELPNNYNQTGKLALSADGKNVEQQIGRGQTVSYDRNEFEGMVGKQAFDKAIGDGKPMTVSVAGGEFKMAEPRTQSQEVSHAR